MFNEYFKSRVCFPLVVMSAFFVFLPLGVLDARTWTNREGKKIEADYVSHEHTEVILKLKKSGKTVKYPILKLSAADIRFLQDMNKKKEQLKEQIKERKTGKRKTKGVTVSEEIIYEVSIKTTMEVPNNRKNLGEIQVWHALPPVRPWSENTGDIGATEITKSEGGEMHFRKEKESYQHYWKLEGPHKAGAKYTFETTFNIRSVTRDFDPSKVNVRWEDYKNDPIVGELQSTRKGSVHLSVARVADKITRKHEPAHALKEFCVWIKKNIKYDASVKYECSDVSSIMRLKKGHCGHQAMIMLELCRHAKIPYRTVFGLNLYEPMGRGGLHKIRADFTNVHTWAKVYFPKVGWVEIEPSGGKNAYKLSACLIQNNEWIQNYMIWITEKKKVSLLPWHYRAGRYTSPFKQELLITYKGTAEEK